MIDKRKPVRRAGVATATACAAVVALAAAGWACANHSGAVWLCPTSTRCSLTTSQSYTHGTTVYSNASSLVANTTFDLKYSLADASTDACHTGTVWSGTGGFTSDTFGNWIGNAVVMPSANASTYSECAVPRTGLSYSNHRNFTST